MERSSLEILQGLPEDSKLHAVPDWTEKKDDITDKFDSWFFEKANSDCNPKNKDKGAHSLSKSLIFL